MGYRRKRVSSFRRASCESIYNRAMSCQYCGVAVGGVMLGIAAAMLGAAKS
jgi:hypothetical protein